MKKPDLKALSLEELKTLRKEVERAIIAYKDRQLEKARVEAEAVVKKHGFSLSEVLGAGGGRKQKAQSAPRYAHPDNPSLTWSGRGRRPGWVNDALAAGKSLDDLKIGA